MTNQDKETTKPSQQLESSAFSHDRFFKDTFSNPKRARKLVEFVLSENELKLYDIKSLRVEKESFIEGRQADIILSLPHKKNPQKRTRLFPLVEHKSQYDKNLFEQILDYIILLRKWVIKQTGFRPLIIPVLFSHGKNPIKWSKSLQEDDFKDDFEEMPLETKKSMLNYGLRIINTKDEKVREWFKNNAKECWGFIRLLDEIWDIKDPDVEEVRSIVKEFFGSELKGATKEEETELVISIIRYLQSAGGLKKEVWKEAEKFLRKDNILTKGGNYMGAIESIREEGMQVGLEKGMQVGLEKGLEKGKKKVALNLLEKNAELSFISEVTGLSVKEIEKLKDKA